MYNTLVGYSQPIQNIGKNVGQFMMLFLGMHTVFWTVEQTYFSWCVQSGMSGWIYSMITNQSIMCTGLRKLSTSASNATASIWFGIISWGGLKLLNIASQFNAGGASNEIDTSDVSNEIDTNEI